MNVTLMQENHVDDDITSHENFQMSLQRETGGPFETASPTTRDRTPIQFLKVFQLAPPSSSPTVPAPSPSLQTFVKCFQILKPTTQPGTSALSLSSNFHQMFPNSQTNNTTRKLTSESHVLPRQRRRLLEPLHRHLPPVKNPVVNPAKPALPNQQRRAKILRRVLELLERKKQRHTPARNPVKPKRALLETRWRSGVRTREAMFTVTVLARVLGARRELGVALEDVGDRALLPLLTVIVFDGTVTDDDVERLGQEALGAAVGEALVAALGGGACQGVVGHPLGAEIVLGLGNAWRGHVAVMMLVRRQS
jgi:hypothetical protein